MDSPGDPLMTKKQNTRRSVVIGRGITEYDRNLMRCLASRLQGARLRYRGESEGDGITGRSTVI